ncbi:CvpA family protein [Nitrosophilus kaiyonis]|uniref:CvpA family protein n=1 Tax=Nitrosophilus kaiyonis TaxID=2930200 RepID=UPI002490BE57|nr:CvpA family protein [Nitrosophilus kaiyonis]
MENFGYFDIIVGIIIILLGLKGLIDGFIKEFFGLLGIIGGIYFGSHYSDVVGKFISENIFSIKNPAALNFVGFLLTLGAFWLAMVFIGKLFAKLSSASGMGIIDRLAGFAFGAAKIFLIFSVIAYAISNIEATKKAVDKYTKNSFLYPYMIKTGSYIIKLNPKDITQKVEEKSEKLKEIIKEKAQSEAVKEIKNKISNSLESNKSK